MPFQYISCYSLSWGWYSQKERWRVSIHLMLLFIGIQKDIQGVFKVVSIHLMLLFIWWKSVQRVPSSVSIHLMLLFIRSKESRSGRWRIVSIHLMLLFILHRRGNPGRNSHVSIHLMLLFIFHHNGRNVRAETFQYISCYSLSVTCVWLHQANHVSIHLMLLFIREINFIFDNS